VGAWLLVIIGAAVGWWEPLNNKNTFLWNTAPGAE
jgi:hypothetical protein